MSGSPLVFLLFAQLLTGGIALLLAPLRLGAVAALLLLFSVAGGALQSGVLLFSGELSSELLVVGGWAPGVGINLRLDPAAALLILMVYAVAFLILLHTLATGERRGTFYGVFGIALAGMVGVILSADLFNLFVFFEVLSLSAAILIAFERTLPAMASAFRYLLLSTLSIALYLLGLFVLYREIGELSMVALSALLPGAESEAVRLGGMLLFAGVATRVALVPFHLWLPEAHAQAPTAVSALLSALMLKASLLAYWRVLSILPGLDYLSLLAGIGAFSALFAGVAALLQEDAKRLLAYSSISQIGYIAAAWAIGGLSGGIYHLLAHAAYKSLLFLIVGSWVHQIHRRSIGELRRSVSWRLREDRLPLLLLLLTLAAVAGVPPFSGYVSKAIVSQVAESSRFYPLLRLSSFFSAGAAARLALIALPSRKGETPGVEAPGALPRSEGSGSRPAALLAGAALLLLFIPSLFLGLFPGWVLQALTPLGLAPPAPPESLYTVPSLASALLVVLAGSSLLLLLRLAPLRRWNEGILRREVGSDGAIAFQALGVVAVALLLTFGVPS
ncbi:MAG: complex I subunit 5 family protein [Alkalispirochaetaceae bacterium]